MKNSFVHLGTLASLGLLVCTLGSAAQGPQPPTAGGGGDEPRPCGDIFIPCWTEDPDSGGGEFAPCTCGTGAWIREVVRTSLHPATAVDVTEDYWVDLTHFITNRAQVATAHSASAKTEAWAWSSFWSEGSRSCSDTASFQHVWREVWKGLGPRCPRKVMLMADGSATVKVTATCSATKGCTAAASASASGSCSSHGDASAEFETGELKCNAAYQEGSASWQLGGSIGPELSVETPSVTGSISSDSNWLAKGTGSCTGNCSLHVRPDRTFCAFTNRTVRARMSGTAGVGGCASVSGNGSASWSAEAKLELWIG